MPRPRESEVKERRLADGSFAFWARITVGVGDRRFVTLGYSREGMDRAGAVKELVRQEALVTLGKWKDPRPSPNRGAEITFDAFAEKWFVAKCRKISPNTISDYRWRLNLHLLPFFGRYRLDQIDAELVEGYIDTKLSERDEIAERLADGERLVDDRGQPVKPLSNTSINSTLELLSCILEKAAKRKLIEANPAADERLTRSAPRRTWLMPDQVLDLIDAAERIDRVVGPEKRERAERVQAFMRRTGDSARQAADKLGLSWSNAKRLAALRLGEREPSPRRAIIATLVLSGLRASELCALRWRDIDFTNRRVAVPGTKTPAAARYVKLVDLLREELLRWKLDAPGTDPDQLVFPTIRKRTFRPRTRHNLASRVVAPAVREANRVRVRRGLVPLPEAITPHSLRRTFVALMLAYRRPVPAVQHEVGHKDARTTLNIYAQVMDTDFAPTRQILRRLCHYSDEQASDPVRAPISGPGAMGRRGGATSTMPSSVHFQTLIR